MITATINLKWAMAHRLAPPYLGPCSSIHGHNYRAEVEVRAPLRKKSKEGHERDYEFDPDTGMVVDFSTLKKEYQGWIDGNLDHALAIAFGDTGLHDLVIPWRNRKDSPFTKLFLAAPDVGQMTAESLVQLLHPVFQNASIVLDKNIQVVRVRVYETDTAWAEWRLER